MSKKILFIALTIAMVAALVGGSTMAWFTVKAAAPVNEFTAGTVMIEAGEEAVYGDASMTNVNPGDAFKKCIPIENTGSKDIRLSMAGEFDLNIDWGWIGENWEELCFSLQAWEDADDLEAELMAALEEGNVTNPADAVGEPNGPFDGAGNLVIPVMVAPTETGDWFMKYVDGQKVFFYDGILESGADTTLCVIVVFDGPWMGNFWQGAKFTLEGTFQAVQASNDAPENVWGTGTWENYETVSGLPTKRDQLAVDFSEAYVNYFYDNDDFIYAYLCEMNGNNGNGENGNGNGTFESTGSAWGEGTPYGPGAQLPMYFEYTKGGSATIYLELQEGANRVAVGDITADGNGTIFINVSTEGYFYDGNPMVMNKAHLYASTEIPTQTAPGQYSFSHKPAGTFTTHEFVVTHIHENSEASGAPTKAVGDLTEGDIIYMVLHAETGYLE